MNFKEMFQGFQSTPLLWGSNAVYGLNQFLPEKTKNPFVSKLSTKKLRLGKWVEVFVNFQLKQNSNIQIVHENLQIRKDKITIGELDVLLLKDQQPIHLEIVYKFYLYDTKQTYDTKLEYWIGPNRNDALISKLNKLKDKQLPLLYNTQTAKIIEKNDFDIDISKQCVCFKAQLFLPHTNDSIAIEPLNKKCVSGYHIPFEKIHELRDKLIYIPSKLDWLIIPTNNMSWLKFDDAIKQIKLQIDTKKSPLIWVKQDIGIHKYFITWW
jgi:hypothetical protein